MRKISNIILLTFVIIGLTMCGKVQLSKSEQPPGLKDKTLIACPDKPNCVSSLSSKDDSHYVEPLKFKGSLMNSVSLLKKALRKMNGKVVAVSGRYIAVIFKTSFFRFTDDLEILIDEKNSLFHIRSSSRVGYSDLGVNRKRVEELRDLYNAYQ